ncbi:MAG: tyrosine--tRNA ligase [Verrucomicrobia bacterium]|nr:tyrosine--tRNA ligase [Verrucomicrobiota bacterium]MBS0645821.1 tyrosine--tRNA ligase [Verrucomicrobiota bacterium]
MQSVVTVLKARGFIDAVTSEELEQLLLQPAKVYVGFDPTADSLHVGNLIAMMGLAWFQRFGHTPIALVGGATGMVGDPSGKSVERNLLDTSTIKKNLEGIQRSLLAVLKKDVLVVNNHDWFAPLSFLDFLRDVGKHFRLSSMLAKDSVKSRLNSEEGLSYTEFSYQLLQAYDFLHLYDHYQVTVQMGGSDQWGNITAGTEFVRKMRGVTVHGLTFPLMTRSDGKKFGKSEEGTIWLNSDRLSAYEFYQYFYRMPDADMPRLLRMLTFLDLEEIIELETKMREGSYEPNHVQKRLAEEITLIVHGQEGLSQAQSITAVARPGAHTELSAAILEQLAKQLPSQSIERNTVLGMSLIDLYVHTKLAMSKGEARRLIENGGLYLNNEQVQDVHAIVASSHLIEGRFLLLQVGKKKKMVLSVV